MPVTDIAFLALIVGAFTFFGGVLGWASWKETQNQRRGSGP
jgi:hypothetical protein